MISPTNSRFSIKSTSQISVAMTLLAAMVLLVFYFVYHAGTLHVMPGFINDQVHHIGLARHLVDYGTVIKPALFPGTGNILYLGLLKMANVRIYMPGYYTVLATFFWLFGVSTFTAILPSMLTFVGSTWLIYYITNTVYGERAAIFAALLFIFTPMTLFYSYLAMTEMPLICVSLGVFAILVALPRRYQAIAIPLLIIVPYLFRQTSAFLLFPMIAYAYDNESLRSKWQMLMLFLFSFALLQVVDHWQVHQGLLKLPILDFLKYGHISYNTVEPANKAMPFFKFLSLVSHHLIANFGELYRTLRFEKYLPKLTKTMFYLGLVMTLLTLSYGFKKRAKALLPLASGVLICALFAVLMLLYSANYNKITRHCMFCVPFLLIIISGMLYDRDLDSHAVFGTIQKYRWYGLLMVVALSLIGNIHAAKHMRRDEKYTAERTRFIESIHPDYQHVLIAPCYMTPEFLYKHYPTLVSFTPMNDATLLLLNQYRKIGTMILNEYDLQYKLSQQAIAKAGLKLTEVRQYRGGKWYVYRKSYEAKNGV